MSTTGNNLKPGNWMKIATAMAFVIFMANTAYAAPIWSYSMDSAADRANPEGSGGSAWVYGANGPAPGFTRTTHRSDGTWNPSNNHYLRVNQLTGMSSSDEDNSGLYFDLYRIGLANGAAYSIGWVSRHGPDWFDRIPDRITPKMIFVGTTTDGSNRVHSHTPMLSEMESDANGTQANIQLSTAPNSVGWTTENGLYTTVSDRDQTVYDYKEYIGEWVYYEITHIHGSKLSISVYTQDGNVAARDLVVTNSDATSAEELLMFSFVTYMQFDGRGTSDSYIDISDLYVGNDFMGPPPGFVTGAQRTPPPNPPSQIQ